MCVWRPTFLLLLPKKTFHYSQPAFSKGAHPPKWATRPQLQGPFDSFRFKVIGIHSGRLWWKHAQPPITVPKNTLNSRRNGLAHQRAISIPLQPALLRWAPQFAKPNLVDAGPFCNAISVNNRLLACKWNPNYLLEGTWWKRPPFKNIQNSH